MKRFLVIISCVMVSLFMPGASLYGETTVPDAVTSGPDPGPLPSTVQPDKALERMTDILDVKAPESIGFDHRIIYGILAVIGIILLIVLIFFLVDLFLKKRKKGTDPQEHPRPPDLDAYQCLEQLEKDGISDSREFYFRLTAILKTYIGGRFGIDAPEMTTEELFPRINDISMEKKLAADLKDLLKRSDPVKFAGVPEERERMLGDFRFAHSFVKQTSPEDPEQDHAVT
ncbi:MAG: hypothetical protein KKD44_25385 [Proteobacteria bacterium]|nr:hypothetical protein [Pseudomonadota bacterium]